jgi:CheY-like chemotaxis protein
MTNTASAQAHGRIVIGVDDQPENLLILQAVLEHAGYFFLGAASGAECISLALRSSPRLILVDIQMPEMDGFETCRRLRAEWSLRRTPIAFLTAKKAPEDVRKGIDAGGNDFLLKPFDPEKLLTRTEYWTKRSLAA